MSQLKKTMRGRLVRIMLAISALTGIATFGIVVTMSAQTSARHLAEVQQHIEDGIVSKGKVLTDNHALALRSLILDNAFVDMQRLVGRAVQEDEELVYGVVVNAERETLVLARPAAPGTPPAAEAAAAEEPPARDAALGLGLSEQELFVDQRVIERKSRLGQDLLEVAVPIISDEGEKLGTLRYGLSTRRMQEALARAAAERESNLLRSVLWIAAMVGITTLLGLLLSRLQAIRITRPVVQLTEAARDLGSGNRAVRVNIASGDELELLGSTFNKMVDELGSSYEQLQELNRTLEQKVDARTAEIALKSRDMRLVLDNVDQGLLTLSPEGFLAGAHSRLISEWFGESSGGEAFFEYMGKASQGFANMFDFAWSQVVEGILPLELAIDQLPSRLEAQGRTWSFRYLPYFDQVQLAGVLVVAAEITERLAKEREEAERAELMHCFTRIMQDRAGFIAFLREADKMVRAICSRALDTDTVLKQTLHTLKGNAGMLGLSLVAKSCHELEEQLAENAKMSDASVQELSERWRRIADPMAALVPEVSERAIEVSAHEYAGLLEQLSTHAEHAGLFEQVQSWRLEPASKPLERLGEQAQLLAQRLGKEGLEVVVLAEGVRLEPESWRPFFAELVHLVRNAVDHGIEMPEERRRRGKWGAGRLVLGARVVRDLIHFEVSDDGRGIAWDAVAAKAEKCGLPHGTQADLVAALFQDGLSTRDEVTETSGRGVGMSSFQRCVERLRGEIEVESSARGTTWRICVPIARLGSDSPASAVSVPATAKSLGERRLTA